MEKTIFLEDCWDNMTYMKFEKGEKVKLIYKGDGGKNYRCEIFGIYDKPEFHIKVGENDNDLIPMPFNRKEWPKIEFDFNVEKHKNISLIVSFTPLNTLADHLVYLTCKENESFEEKSIGNTTPPKVKLTAFAFDLALVTIDGKSTTMQVEKTYTIGLLKDLYAAKNADPDLEDTRLVTEQAIEELRNPTYESQKCRICYRHEINLFCDGKMMIEDKTLEDYGISSKCVIRTKFKLTGYSNLYTPTELILIQTYDKEPENRPRNVWELQQKVEKKADLEALRRFVKQASKLRRKWDENYHQQLKQQRLQKKKREKNNQNLNAPQWLKNIEEQFAEYKDVKNQISYSELKKQIPFEEFKKLMQ